MVWIDIAEYGRNDLYSAMQAIMDIRYSIIAMFFLQIYELFAMMEEEVRLIHRASWTSITALYLLCRYYPLVLWFLVIWAYVSDHDAQTCSRVAQAVHASLAPCQILSQAVMLMRAHAFSGRNKKILVLLASCYICLVVVDIWAFCWKVDMPPPILYSILGGTGCFPNYEGEVMALRTGLAAILMDLVSLVVVVMHCVKSRWDQDVSLARYFVSQGLASFAFISIINIVTAITLFRIVQLREQVTLTESELSRRHSILVRNALSSPISDSWVIYGTGR
ncbi:hypothetical protein M413DRAFT_440489 [Hebeloma cylindrosporum]|uniref:DUF6533 domain-containing protein n=1 Tax=Hebeloma cylindrosporum TaxID=76867 RepID=A0A0C3CS70_HEBCY|nr:hypothetical protein M413DRAFT_440489 [Hebeloma cylindrosporum h7]